MTSRRDAIFMNRRDVAFSRTRRDTPDAVRIGSNSKKDHPRHRVMDTSRIEEG